MIGSARFQYASTLMNELTILTVPAERVAQKIVNADVYPIALAKKLGEESSLELTAKIEAKETKKPRERKVLERTSKELSF